MVLRYKIIIKCRNYFFSKKLLFKINLFFKNRLKKGITNLNKKKRKTLKPIVV